MSLKAFHIVFIAVSILLAMFVGGWGVRRYLDSGGIEALLIGGFFFASAFALLAYGIKFLRKIEEWGI